MHIHVHNCAHENSRSSILSYDLCYSSVITPKHNAYLKHFPVDSRSSGIYYMYMYMYVHTRAHQDELTEMTMVESWQLETISTGWLFSGPRPGDGLTRTRLAFPKTSCTAVLALVLVTVVQDSFRTYSAKSSSSC